MAVKTYRGLLKALKSERKPGGAELMLVIGGKTYKINARDLHSLTSNKAAFISSDSMDLHLAFELDGKSADPVADQIGFDFDAIYASIMPDLGPPAEFVEAVSKVQLPKPPKGWTYALVGGQIKVVKDDGSADGGTSPFKKPRAKRGMGPKKESKPRVTVGMRFTRKRDGTAYRVSQVDGAIRLDPLNPGQAEPEIVPYMANGKSPNPAFWRQFGYAEGNG